MLLRSPISWRPALDCCWTAVGLLPSCAAHGWPAGRGRQGASGERADAGALQVEFEDADDLAAVAADVDVLYQTRIQKERFQVGRPGAVWPCRAAAG